jgi:hypothetical protein
MPKTTLNRFPLFGLFAYRAANHMGYPEEDGKLLGYSTAVLYAIFKAKLLTKKGKAEKEKKELPEEIRKAKTDTITFGGQQYMVIYGKGKRLKQAVVGNELHAPEDYEAGIKAKFPEGWYNRLLKAFDQYLKDQDADELNKGNTLFDLYKAWRDECKVGFNRVDLDKLFDWLQEHEKLKD